MSVELLYTSAPSGLRQGSRGFCTVISTTGMPINLATKLESLSGYRHVFPPQYANAEMNPVCHSHLKVKVAGRSSSVLSRIAAFGVDYSGRTNKLAHHVVVEPNEQSPAGPSWALGQPSIMRTTWDGNIATPQTGPAIGRSDQGPRVCSGWGSIMGDAGWGGVIADAFASATSTRPTWIVFEVHQGNGLLNLIDESISLLEPSRRWSATFSTYFTNLPPEIDCQVRCVIAGSDEARLAVARGVVIDLTRPAPAPGRSPLIELARTGRTATRPVVAAPAIPVRAPLPVPQDSGLPVTPVSSGLVLDEDFADESELRIGPPVHRLATASSAARKRPNGPPPTPSKPKRSPVILAALAIVSLLLFGGTTLFYVKRATDQAAAQINDLAKIGSASHTKPVESAPIPIVKTENPEEVESLWIVGLEKQFDNLEMSVNQLVGKIPARPILPIIEVDIRFPENGLATINEKDDWAQKHKDLTGAEAKDAYANRPEIKLTAGKLKSLIGNADSLDTNTLCGVKKQNENRLKQMMKFNETVDQIRTNLAPLLQKLRELNGKLNRESVLGQIANRRSELQTRVNAVITKVENISDNSVSTKELGAAVESNDKTINAWKTALEQLKSFEEVCGALKTKSEALAELNSESDKQRRTMKLVFRIDNTGASIEAKKSFDLEAHEVKYATEYRAFVGNDSNPAIESYLKIDRASNSASFPNLPPIYGCFVLDAGLGTTEKPAGLRLCFTAKSKTNDAGASEFSRSVVELLKAIDDCNSLGETVSRWSERKILPPPPNSQRETVFQAEQRKQDELFNSTRNRIQQSLKNTNPANVNNESVRKLDSWITELKSFNGKDIPISATRAKQLELIQDAFLKVIELRDKLAAPEELPELSIELLKSEKKNALDSTRATSLGTYKFQPILQLDIAGGQ